MKYQVLVTLTQSFSAVTEAAEPLAAQTAVLAQIASGDLTPVDTRFEATVEAR